MPKAWLAICLMIVPLIFASTGETVAVQNVTTLRGTVTRTGTQTGIANVRITAIASPPPGVIANDAVLSEGLDLTATTDAQGRYSISGVPPGRYSIRAQREGYLGPSINGVKSSFSVRSISIDREQQLLEVNFVLGVGGAILGRVRGLDGKNASGLLVAAQRLDYLDGRPRLVQWGTGVTNDQGDYRISGIPAGEYYVGTRTGSAIAAARNRQQVTLYPGVSSLNAAVRVTVWEGSESTGVDFAMQEPSSAVFTISGRAIPPTGQTGVSGAGSPPSIDTVYLVPRDPSVIDLPFSAFQNVLSQEKRRSGEFEIRDIPSGSYDLFPAFAGGDVYYTARMPIEVRGADVRNLSIVTSEGASLSGQVVLRGSLPVRLESIRMNLRPLESLPAPFIVRVGVAQPDATGVFMFSNVPEGRYALEVVGLPEAAYIEDIRQRAASTFDGGVTIARGIASPVQVILSMLGAEVEGIARGIDREAVPNATVVVVPASPQRRQNRALYKTAVADELGHYTIKSIPPGDYKLFAWDNVPDSAWLNSDYLAEYEQQGQLIHVRQGEVLQAAVRVITDPR